MAELCNYYTFTNITNMEDFLANIRDCASLNGWIIDKDDITDNKELYLHSNHGGRNLYFSMRSFMTHDPDEPNAWYHVLELFANTGFDDSKSVNEQPGKWGEWTAHWYDYDYRFKLFFPMLHQYVIASSQALFVFYDCYKSEILQGSDVHIEGSLPGRWVLSLAFGGIDLYNDSDTEGNFFFCDYPIIEPNYNDTQTWIFYIHSSAFGTNTEVSDIYPTEVLYYGGNKINADCGISTARTIRYGYGRYETTLPTYGKKGFKYCDGVRLNEWSSRTSMIKPIVSIHHEDAENQYFFPIGEFPYYACKAYPHAKAGDVLSFGTRKFIVFPLISYTEEYGIAIEVNP